MSFLQRGDTIRLKENKNHIKIINLQNAHAKKNYYKS